MLALRRSSIHEIDDAMLELAKSRLREAPLSVVASDVEAVDLSNNEARCRCVCPRLVLS